MREDSDSRLKVMMKPDLILRIDNPSEALILEALKRKGSLIQHFKNPTIDMQLAAYRDDPDCVRFIDNPSPAILGNLLTDDLQGGLKADRPPVKKTCGRVDNPVDAMGVSRRMPGINRMMID